MQSKASRTHLKFADGSEPSQDYFKNAICLQELFRIGQKSSEDCF